MIIVDTPNIEVVLLLNKSKGLTYDGIDAKIVGVTTDANDSPVHLVGSPSDRNHEKRRQIFSV